jgi:hypothetical protein
MKMTPDEIMEYTVGEILREGVQIIRFLADSPERNLILGIGGCTSYYGCEIIVQHTCLAKLMMIVSFQMLCLQESRYTSQAYSAS